MDKDLAKLISEPFWKEWVKRHPDSVTFFHHVDVGGKTYEIKWSKDVNVANPGWHINYTIIN